MLPLHVIKELFWRVINDIDGDREDDNGEDGEECHLEPMDLVL